MVRAHGEHVVAIAPRSAPFNLQVVDQGIGLVADQVAGPPPAVSELSLEAIGHPHEVAVESAKLQGLLPRHGKVAANELLNKTRAGAVEQEWAVLRINFPPVPGLEDAASHHGPREHLTGPLVGPQQLGCRKDVVIDEENPLTSSFHEGEVHGTGDAGLAHPEPADAPLLLPPPKPGLGLVIVTRGLIDQQ